MKVACVYHPRLHAGCGKFHFVADAFRALGHDVTHVRTLAELRAADAACDLVLFEQRQPAEISVLDIAETEKHAVWAQWFFDLNVFDDSLPMARQPTVEPYLPAMRAMDLVCVKERDRLEGYQAAGVNTVWLDQGCPAGMPEADLVDEPEFDVILWGSTRAELWRQRCIDAWTLAQAGFRVGWATTEGYVPEIARLPGCQPLELPSVIARGAVSLVVDARQDIDGYWSDRVWLALGAGACVLRRDSDQNRIGGQGCYVGYRTHEEMLAAVRHLRSAPHTRRQIGQAARDWVMQDHTYEARCREIIEHVEKQGLSEMSGHEMDQGARREETALSGVS